MSAREIIEPWLADVQHGFRDRDIEDKASDLLSALTAAGYRIVGPGCLDGETLGRAAFVADTLGNGTGNNKAIAKAIRALAKGEEG